MRDTETAEQAPLVSVVIPAYRAAESIAATLDSVLAQTFKDYEIIVVNDGSPDSEDLEKALDSYRERIIYLRQENQGPAGARNTGILTARGKYIALLDSDDIWDPEHLGAQLAVLEADKSIDVVYADARIFGDVPEAGRTVMEFCPSAGEVTFERLVTRQCTVHLCVSVCRRESLLARRPVRSGISRDRGHRHVAAHREAGRPDRLSAPGPGKLPPPCRESVLRPGPHAGRIPRRAGEGGARSRNSPPHNVKRSHGSAPSSAPAWNWRKARTLSWRETPKRPSAI